MRLLSLIKREKYKVLATLILSLFFIYFWVNGPIINLVTSIDLDKEATIYSQPKMTTDSAVTKIIGFGEVENVNSKGHGFGLIKAKDEAKKHTNLIQNEVFDKTTEEEFANNLLRHAQLLYPNATSYTLKLNADPIFVIIENEEILYYIESKGIVQDVYGYAGNINIGIILSEKRKIKSVHHISSHETESYLRKILKDGFYTQLEDISTSSEYEIDAVSGATLSSEAIATITSKLVNYAKSSLLSNYIELNPMSQFEVIARLRIWWVAHILIILLLFIYAVQKKISKRKRDVYIFSILSVIYIGFFLNNSFTYISFIHPFLGTSISSMVALYALFTLLGAIWGKNTYCKYVCPYGNIQRLALKLTPSVTRDKFFISTKWIGRIRAIITIVLLLGIFLGMSSWKNFELFPDLFGLEYTSIWFYISVFIIVLNIRYPLLWCRILCPTGAVLDFITQLVNKK